LIAAFLLAHGALSSTISSISSMYFTAGKLRFLVALPPVRDLFICAKDLFVAAMTALPVPQRAERPKEKPRSARGWS
jgi:hypothetical protein